MKQYFFKGKPIEMGKAFSIAIERDGNIHSYTTSKMNESFAEFLVSRKILTTHNNNSKGGVSYKELTFEDCINYYAVKNNWAFGQAAGFLTQVADMCNSAAFTMLLKAAAILMDRTHEGHISNEPVVWAVSLIDYSVFPIKREKIKDYMNLSVFRSKEEAIKALEILTKFPLPNGK